MFVTTIRPPPPIIPIGGLPNLRFEGGGSFLGKIFRKRGRQRYSYSPSLIASKAVGFGISMRLPKSVTSGRVGGTGLEIRPEASRRGRTASITLKTPRSLMRMPKEGKSPFKGISGRFGVGSMKMPKLSGGFKMPKSPKLKMPRGVRKIRTKRFGKV
jgi:hypothetical protein